MDKSKIKGIIFDYGATIDTNGRHWKDVLWDAYIEQQIPVSRDAFYEAYVYGERYLATHEIVSPEDDFLSVLLAKTHLQAHWLIERGFLENNALSSFYPLAVSVQCNKFVLNILKNTIPVLEKLALQYHLVLVSNFYGNIETVLKDFGLDLFFKKIIESAVVKIRKPDPAIFALGVEALGLSPEEVVVVGDSHSKDIVPAQKLGCQTIWLKGSAWEDDFSGQGMIDVVITDFSELEKLLLN
ncbi:hypothetical protein AGMMS50262_00280 [Bacteroidia bacterium]|nr:hypothetical protein AGMMS50262_00280 [Bacteroidia bacterium]